VIPLLDVNVLVALAWPNHVHHDVARAWFERHAAGGWASCSLTQGGFVRVSSNPQAIPGAKTPREALALLEVLTASYGHRFWADDVELAKPRHFAREQLVGYRQITDAQLLALALRHGGRLATLDRAIRRLVPAGVEAEERVVVIAG
jgi:hypothetical protein